MIPDSFKLLPSFLIKDYNAIASDAVIPWENFRGKTILVTGATGEIGREIVKALLFVESEKKLGLHVLCLSRSKEKVQKVFGTFLKDFKHALSFIYGDVTSFEVNASIDYVIHTASPTASAYFTSNPCETIDSIVEGTRHVLKIARDKSIASMAFLSSLEVYGTVDSDNIYEEDLGEINLDSERSSYPEAKRLAELFCYCACKEYGIPVKRVRLAQTFGTHLSEKDNRVYAQFARAAREGKDIVLHTQGQTCRDYLYTLDAVRAILTVLTLGEEGKAYNVSDPESFLSIREMADLVATFNPNSHAVVSSDATSAKNYAPTVRIRLNNERINAMNNFKRTSIKTMFKHLIVDLDSVDSE